MCTLPVSVGLKNKLPMQTTPDPFFGAGTYSASDNTQHLKNSLAS